VTGSPTARERLRRRPTIRDVAQFAGVAVSSASRVLSGHPDVSDDMRARVLSAVEKLGYEPDFLAQSFRSGATMSVGFISLDVSSPVLAEVAMGAESALRASGYSMLILNSEGDSARDVQHIRWLERRRVDGVLISLADETSPEMVSALRSLNVPVVLIDREVAGADGVSAVLCDWNNGIRSVVAHFAALGHRRVGLVSGNLQIRPGRAAVQAFLECASDLNVHPLVISGPFEEGHGHRATHEMLDSTAPPTAIIAGGDQIFLGVLRAIRERGLNIPNELSLATFDDLPLLNLLEPPVDVVHRRPRVFGEILAGLMLQALQGAPAEVVVAPVEFESRGSSGPPNF
jgi:LacI family transcriptional regulator